jgi:hypothetical protein
MTSNTVRRIMQARAISAILFNPLLMVKTAFNNQPMPAPGIVIVEKP